MVTQKAWNIFINNKIEVKIITKSANKTIKYIRNLNINIYNVSYKKDHINLVINYNDYNKVEKFFNVEIIKKYGINEIKDCIKKSKYPIIYFIFTILTIFLFTRVIIDINVITNNKDLQRTILNELDKEGLRKYTFIKSDPQILEIKNNILNKNKNLLEWINIERIGMKYVVNLEPKVEKNRIDHEEYCHVISLKDAMITRIIASNGMEIKAINDSVKKGEIIISGDISYNEEVKARVCATGIVYGKTWYTINISMPKKYEHISKKSKKRFNLGIEYNNKKTKIFKSRLQDYTEENKKIINIFGIELKLIKEIEVERTIKEYNQEELNKNIINLVDDKMSKTLEGEYEIIDRKVLKKSDNNSTIDIEIFIVAEEQISEVKATQITEIESPKKE